MDNIILVSFGGHAKSVADSIDRCGLYNIIGYTDIADRNCQYKYLGTDEVLDSYLAKGYNKIAICMGYLGKGTTRESIYYSLKDKGFVFPIIIDPSAIVSSSTIVEEGTFIGKNAVVNADARVGKMCIINTGAVVEHDCIVGDFSHVSVGAVLCGQVRVGKAAFIGANSTVIQCQNIDEGKIVPAGVTIR